MRARFRSSSLVPAGFVVDHLDVSTDRISLVVRSEAAMATCPDCRTTSRRIQSLFAERFPDAVLPTFARRTSRLEQIVHRRGLALGGWPGAGLAQRLMLPVSRDTLLRLIRRRATTWSDPLGVIGIDDFAWRRNHRYGTLGCDLERRSIVALLSDREQATVQTWLKASHEAVETRVTPVHVFQYDRSADADPSGVRRPSAGSACLTDSAT